VRLLVTATSTRWYSFKEMDDKDVSQNLSLQRLSQYLSPDWVPDLGQSDTRYSAQYPEYLIYDEKSENSSLSLIELVATELHSYLNSYLQIYLEEVKRYPEEEIESHLIETIKQNAIENSSYCRKIVAWIVKSHLPPKFDAIPPSDDLESRVIEFFNKLCDEYMKSSPGPWREAVLLEAIRGHLTALSSQLISSSLFS
jgi:hypothetical protein